MTDYQTIQTQKEEDGLLTITLSRPDVMNAFNARMMHEMVDALDHADADDTVRAIIVTGSGERAFCAGADLKDFKNNFSLILNSIILDYQSATPIYTM